MPRTAGQWVYWIVQPLRKGFGPTAGGFTVYFWPYPMGREEYEYPGPSLAELYEAAGGAPVVEPHQVTVAGTSRTVYFVGPAQDLAFRARDMEAWLSSGAETKIPCQFADFFHASLADRERMTEAQQRIEAAHDEYARQSVAQLFSESTEDPGPEPPARPRFEIAWWVMQNGFMFTLDSTVAADLLKAIQLEATTHEAFGDSGWA